MTKRQQDVIEFLRNVWRHGGETKLWILNDLARHHGIRVKGEWDKDNQCPVFEAMPQKPCYGKSAFTEKMIEEGWRNAN